MVSMEPMPKTILTSRVWVQTVTKPQTRATIEKVDTVNISAPISDSLVL